jgi:hypothetical protein
LNCDIYQAKRNSIPPKPGTGVVVPSAEPEPKREAEVPDPKSEDDDVPDDPNKLEVAADEEPNKDELGTAKDEALAEENDDAAGVNAAKGDDAEGCKGVPVLEVRRGFDAGGAVEISPAA